MAIILGGCFSLNVQFFFSGGSRSGSGDAASLKQELDDTIAKHELLEEEYVVAKARWIMFEFAGCF